MKIHDMLEEKRDKIVQIAEKHGASNIRIFGSALRGEATPESDVDFLVDVGSDHSPFFPGGMVADLEDFLGCRVDIVTENGLHWYIRDKVLNEAVPL